MEGGSFIPYIPHAVVGALGIILIQNVKYVVVFGNGFSKMIMIGYR